MESRPDDADDSVSTVGAEILACANYLSFQDAIDKFAAQNGFGADVERIRNAVGHAVDHGVDGAAQEYDLSADTVVHALEWLNRAASNEYPHRYDRRT